MLIEDTKKISDIQQDFHREFPFLKLEFYTEGHPVGESSPAREQLDPGKTLAETRSIHASGDLHIVPTMTVSELEKLFTEKYGLNAQVFRRSGNLWLQTSTTDHWPLAEQNRKGGHSEELFNEKYG
ncbi:MAG: hypothetical protein HY842_03835 [Bacteroidetes bacterium]|nr:hypothetical protein [Bacteroidota bacterium]